ncbi:MAG: ABC transporter substrate-binding protein [Gammaproteobacteria bacterium]|nr:ABC transporter substrate-binding protein [Gammaproteobacteria bacterium]
MKLKKSLVIVLFLLISVPIFAADPAPLVMLKSTSSQMLQELDKHIGQLKNNRKLVNNLVNTIVVPHFDLLSMSRAVIGRTYWQQASSNTQQEFIKEFTAYVIRTYSSALQSYDGETMKFYPIRGEVGNKTRISSDLMLKNGPPIQLQYGLVKQGSQWLIYDFSVDGVSIIKNYQSQFAGILRQKGLDGLVRQLQQRNGAR